MTADLSSVARKAAERAYPTRLPYNAEFERRVQLREGFERGFTECASRIPSVTEFAEALFDADGDAESGIEWTPFAEQSPGVRGAYLIQARAVRALIGERLKQ